MAFLNHTRVSFGGSLSVGVPFSVVGDEIWQCNVNVVDGASTDLGASAAAYMEQIAAPLLAWFTAAGNHLSRNAKLDWLKVNNIGPDGRYQSPTTTNQHDYTGAIDTKRGPDAATVPQILTLAVSWRTVRRRGPGAHGRVYLPNGTWGDPTNMRVDGTNALIAGKALLVVLANAAGSIDAIPVVASKVDASNTPVTAVTVGNVVDVQRRRKNALAEAYSDLPFP